ncbi:MAG: metallophosphoesterase [Myxococcales bacterium]|nr:metallophosphoesterase [Myxococcales bacterium]
MNLTRRQIFVCSLITLAALPSCLTDATVEGFTPLGRTSQETTDTDQQLANTDTRQLAPDMAGAADGIQSDAAPDINGTDDFNQLDSAETPDRTDEASDWSLDAPETSVDLGEDQTNTAASEPILVGVIADMNGSYGSTTYVSQVRDAVTRLTELNPDVVLSAGDMVAGQKAGLDYDAMWDAFHEAVSDPLAEAGIPFAVTPGNHDASGYSGYAGERAIFQSEWSNRRPDVDFVDDSNYPLSYSFVVGPAFFISLDATKVGNLDQTQMNWIEDQLIEAEERGYDVTIVYGHVPLYGFAIGRETEILDDDELEELLLDHHVDLVISGHHHAYYPGRRDDLRLVGTACLGTGPRPLIGTDETSARSLLLFEVSESGVEWLDAYGGSDFTVPIERSDLPSSVGSGSGLIWRDDLDF